MAQLEDLMGRINHTSYGPTEPYLWLVGKIPPKTSENCRETSERKSQTHSYDDLVDLLLELAIKRENDSYMDKYLHKHLQREIPAEKAPRGRSPQPNSKLGKGCGAHLEQMTETPSSKGKGDSHCLYCRSTDDKGGPCHAPGCDGRRVCMPQLKRTQKTKDGQEVKHQDHFRCTRMCGYCGKRRHYEAECHINAANPKNLRKRKRSGVRMPVRVINPRGGA